MILHYFNKQYYTILYYTIYAGDTQRRINTPHPPEPPHTTTATGAARAAENLDFEISKKKGLIL